MNKITKKCLGINLRYIFSCTFSQSQDENTIEKQLFSYCVANVNTLRNKLLLQQKIGYLHEKCKEIEENNRMGKTRDFFKKIRDTKERFHASSVQFSLIVQSCPTLRPHELQHTRPPCPSLTPGVQPNSCPSSRWCHPAILSFVIPFSSCPQSLPASGSFPMSQLFAWGGQSIGVSASASVLPVNT